MKPGQLPQTIGNCAHCGQELYAGSPVAMCDSQNAQHGKPGDVAHVACVVDARRRA